MLKKAGVLVMALTLLFGSNLMAGDQGKTYESRDQIPEKYKWDLTPLFASQAEWAKEREAVEALIPEFKNYQGKLATSAQTLQQCLDFMTDVLKRYYKLSAYASRLSDQDTRESGPMAMRQEISQVGNKLSAAMSFIEPEILSIPQDVIDKFFKENPKLAVYRQYIDNIQRMKPHTLSPQEEKIIAHAGLMSDTPYDIYGIFKNADMPRPEITLPDGKTVKLDDATYTLYRADDNRDLRIKVFEQFFGAYKQFERTFGTDLYSQLKKDLFYKTVRKYDSCLEAALTPNNIPTSVYMNLIESVNENLPTLHRYLKLRKKMLGVDELHYYDMYAPLVPKVDLTYSVDEAEDLILEALEPLGDEYEDVLKKAFNERWIDMFPNTGKRSGAYSSGAAYDVHPYILMNFMGKYEDVSTLAHELGHTMHSYFSNKNQHFINAQYPIFLAEVASTCNEALLVNHVLKKIDDPKKRLSILGNQLETFRTTLFRQTQFAEFELKIHELVEKGEALTGDKLSRIYLDILKKYYGHDAVTKIEDLYGIEWAYIPHFYYNFYVFQYATSLCASTALSEKIMKEGKPMADKYVKEFLSAGSSDYAIPILQKVGVDMTTKLPYEQAFAKMNRIMDEIEKLLEETEK
ncbi:oligoendopeptidase F [Caldithrix abyssi DSM 13497]|uniref:Oligopeptidase F n=1 Tax=Caldithrix abyssi DSM 13497 TaxID=880073 RepID=H1XX31_CALAY|nr:oligoendopeptidase F [Caldithrix abyssi]APF20733.1 oligopeptidase F, Metallo peptidase, MEROPS family M03B [Caldithrix abyssi DSM 13497]EHO40768.1 oligoendopeptidase F [Caldithrix abyssi DSM 13497]